MHCFINTIQSILYYLDYDACCEAKNMDSGKTREWGFKTSFEQHYAIPLRMRRFSTLGVSFRKEGNSWYNGFAWQLVNVGLSQSHFPPSGMIFHRICTCYPWPFDWTHKSRKSLSLAVAVLGSPLSRLLQDSPYELQCKSPEWMKRKKGKHNYIKMDLSKDSRASVRTPKFNNGKK